MAEPTLFDKTCSRCQVTKSALTDFYRSPQCRDGLNGVCKQCQAGDSARRYALRRADPQFKARMAANTRRAYERTLADPAKLARRLETTRRWRERNRDRMSEQYRSWRLANADKVREKNQRRRARLLGAFVAPVDPAAIWVRDEGVCQICMTPVDPELEWPDRWCGTIDHIIPLSRGGTHEPDQVQLAHHRCNSQKNDRLVS